MPKRRYHAPRDHHADALEWIEKHPWAFAELSVRCMEMARAGRRFGFKMIVERMRWEGRIKKLEHEDYALNNNLTSHVIRRIVQLHPEVKGFIKFRKVRADEPVSERKQG